MSIKWKNRSEAERGQNTRLSFASMQLNHTRLRSFSWLATFYAWAVLRSLKVVSTPITQHSSETIVGAVSTCGYNVFSTTWLLPYHWDYYTGFEPTSTLCAHIVFRSTFTFKFSNNLYRGESGLRSIAPYHDLVLLAWRLMNAHHSPKNSPFVSLYVQMYKKLQTIANFFILYPRQDSNL